MSVTTRCSGKVPTKAKKFMMMLATRNVTLFAVVSLLFALNGESTKLAKSVVRMDFREKSFFPFATLEKAALTGILSMSTPIAVFASSDPILQVAAPAIDIFINTLSVLFLARTILSWYPKTDLNEYPYNIVAWPTEPLLTPVRAIVPPAFGVDVSALVWIAVLSFFREILTGQQGILTLMERA